MQISTIASGRYTAIARTEGSGKFIETLAASSPTSFNHPSITLSEQLRIERRHGLRPSLQEKRDVQFQKDLNFFKRRSYEAQPPKIYFDRCADSRPPSRHFRSRNDPTILENFTHAVPLLHVRLRSKAVAGVSQIRPLHNTRRPISLGPDTNLRGRPSPVSLGPATKLPLRGPSSPSTKPKTSIPIPGKARSFPGNGSWTVDNEEVMVSGVREGDKQKDARTREYSASYQRFQLRLEEAENDYKVYCAEARRMEDINHEMIQTRGQAKVDYRYAPIEDTIEKSATITFQLGREIESCTGSMLQEYETAITNAKERYSKKYYEIILRPLEEQLYEIRLKIDGFRAERDVLVRSSRNQAAIAFKGAEALVSGIVRVKEGVGGDQKTQELWRNINDLSETIEHLVRHYMDEKISMIRSGQAVPPRLAEICDIGERLAKPFGPDAVESDSWNIPIRDLAHKVREIELNMELTKHEKDITFAERWAKSIVARYVWPCADANIELGSQIHRMIPDDHSEIAQMTTHYGGLAGTRWLKNFRRFKAVAQGYVKKAEKTVQIFSDLIGQGNILLCPHPDEFLHLRQLPLMRAIERYSTAWTQTIGASKEARRSIGQVVQELSDRLTESNIRDREYVMHKLSLLQRPPRNTEDPLSRRGFWQSRHEAMIWHSVSLLFGGRPVARIELQQETIAAQDGSIEEPKLQRSVTTENDAGNSPSEPWLYRRTLYPIAHPVIIDFVASRGTLAKVLEELSSQQIIGYDVITAEKGSILNPRIDYLLMASQAHVYILDVGALRRSDYGYFCGTMGKILESESILKVGMGFKNLSHTLWNDFALNLTTFYDLAQHNRNDTPPTFDGLLSLLGQTFKVHDIFVGDLARRLPILKHEYPKSFFYYLAMRTYAPLRLFQALNQNDVVQTSDKVLFNACSFNRSQQYQDVKYELGPVNIDRHVSAFHRPSRYTTRRSAMNKDIYTHSRDMWLREMALAMARQFLQRVTVKSLLDLTQSPIAGPASKEEIEEGIAAYYLATVFCETLRTIEKCLRLTNVARWILWAARMDRLRLHPDDQAKYERAAILTDSNATDSSHLIESMKDAQDRRSNNVPKRQKIRSAADGSRISQRLPAYTSDDPSLSTRTETDSKSYIRRRNRSRPRLNRTQESADSSDMSKEETSKPALAEPPEDSLSQESIMKRVVKQLPSIFANWEILEDHKSKSTPDKEPKELELDTGTAIEKGMKKQGMKSRKYSRHVPKLDSNQLSSGIRKIKEPQRVGIWKIQSSRAPERGIVKSRKSLP